MSGRLFINGIGFEFDDEDDDAVRDMTALVRCHLTLDEEGLDAVLGAADQQRVAAVEARTIATLLMVIVHASERVEPDGDPDSITAARVDKAEKLLRELITLAAEEAGGT